MIIRPDKSPSEINPFKGAHSPSENPPQIDRAQRRFRWIMQDLLFSLRFHFRRPFSGKIIYIYFAVDYPWYQFRPATLGHVSAQFTQKSTSFYHPFINPLPRWVMQTYPGSCGKVQIFERKYCEQSVFCNPRRGFFFSTVWLQLGLTFEGMNFNLFVFEML